MGHCAHHSRMRFRMFLCRVSCMLPAYPPALCPRHVGILHRRIMLNEFVVKDLSSLSSDELRHQDSHIPNYDVGILKQHGLI